VNASTKQSTDPDLSPNIDSLAVVAYMIRRAHHHPSFAERCMLAALDPSDFDERTGKLFSHLRDIWISGQSTSQDETETAIAIQGTVPDSLLDTIAAINSPGTVNDLCVPAFMNRPVTTSHETLTKLFSVSADETRTGGLMADLLTLFLDDLEAAYNGSTVVPATGILPVPAAGVLNANIEMFRNGRVYSIETEPDDTTTSLAAQIALRYAVGGNRVLYLTNETPTTAIARYVAKEMGLPLATILEANITGNQWPKLTNVISRLAYLPLQIHPLKLLDNQTACTQTVDLLVVDSIPATQLAVTIPKLQQLAAKNSYPVIYTRSTGYAVSGVAAI
jgi:hypothetical protein